MESAGMLIGYDKVSLYIKDGMVEAALITEDIYAKNIRVLINNSDSRSFYHDAVSVTSDSAFTVTVGNSVTEYEANFSAKGFKINRLEAYLPDKL